MSQMLNITTPRKSNFSEGAHLRTPQKGILFSTQQKLYSTQLCIQFRSVISITYSYDNPKNLRARVVKETVTDIDMIFDKM